MSAVTCWDGEHGFDPAAEVLFRVEVTELTRPHIVVTRDVLSGRVSFAGPYPSAVAALCAADTEAQVAKDLWGGSDLSFSVAALYPPSADTSAQQPATDSGADLANTPEIRPARVMLRRRLGDLAMVGRGVRARRPSLIRGTQ